MTVKLVKMESVAAGYVDKIILRDINFTIHDRDFIGIIGPNGGGKTTLMRVLLGLIRPLAGTIEYSNDIFSRGKREIGYLPQFRVVDLQFPIRVRDVVFSGLMSSGGIFKRFSSDDEDRVNDILARFGVSHLRDKTIGDLSGGQMQRVFLCRALVSSPRLLVLDEPDTFVDSSFSVDLNQILQDLNKEIAIVLVSHDLGSVLESVKNIACVNGTLHYHSADEGAEHIMESMQCSFRLVWHGDVPHTVLKKHGR
jgi:zinc transport system ATP-binding protein